MGKRTAGMGITVKKSYETKYYGIHICENFGKYWLFDANGNERYIGCHYATEKEIKHFRDCVTGDYISMLN